MEFTNSFLYKFIFYISIWIFGLFLQWVSMSDRASNEYINYISFAIASLITSIGGFMVITSLIGVIALWQN